MSTDRETILERLATIHNTASVNTVVRANQDIDLNKYTQAQEPIVQLIPLGEVPEYGVGRTALWRFGVQTTLFYLASKQDEVLQETLTGEIKDAIGGDPTLNELCEMVIILAITPGGEFPIYSILFEYEILYEKGIANA